MSETRCILQVLVVLAAGTLAAGCRRTTLPSTSGAVLQMIDENDATTLKAEAPESFAKAARYATLSEEMSRAGDDQGADRYLQLSRHHLKMARLIAEKRELVTLISNTDKANDVLVTEITNTKIALENLAATMERRAMREHLETVVDETRRRAAAEETARERRYLGKEKRAIHRARTEVAHAMIARAEVWLDVLAFLSKADESGTTVLDSVSGPIAAARAALSTIDLALVQEYLEAAGAAYQERLSNAFETSRFDPATKVAALAEDLENAGFEMHTESVGVSLVWPTKSSTDTEHRLADILARYPDIGLVLLTSWRAAGDPVVESEKLACATAQSLRDAGIPETRLHARGVGEQMPLDALKSNDIATALLLVPIPGA